MDRSEVNGIKTVAASVCSSVLLSLVVIGISDDPFVDSLMKKLVVVIGPNISDLVGTLGGDVISEESSNVTSVNIS